MVFGDSAHPEVESVLGWAGEKSSAALYIPPADTLPNKLGIICQTTQVPRRFSEFVSGVISDTSGKTSELRIFNTICDATRKHQAATVKLATRVDLMIVIGGRNSANTNRLTQICKDMGVATHHIETAEEVVPSWLKGCSRVGITAGASTPDEVINEVETALKKAAEMV